MLNPADGDVNIDRARGDERDVLWTDGDRQGQQMDLRNRRRQPDTEALKA